MTEEEEERLVRLEKTVAVSVIIGIVAAAWSNRIVMMIVDAMSAPVFNAFWTLFERAADWIGSWLPI